MPYMNINLTSYGQGTPLVFFHGWGFDSQIWLPLVPELKAHYQLILVDLPGFGLTSMMEWPEFKKSLLTILPLRFAVAGWSMGGLYATRLAAEEPQRVQCLLNISSSPRFITDSLWPGVSKEVFINFYNNLSSNLTATLNEFIALQINKTKVCLQHGTPPSVLGLKSGLQILDTWDLREELKKLEMPTCYLFGRLDPITSVKTMQTMKSDYPNFKYVLFHKSAHMPFLSHKKEFIDEVLGFIT